MSFIKRSNLLCPLFGVSFKRGFTVYILQDLYTCTYIRRQHTYIHKHRPRHTHKLFVSCHGGRFTYRGGKHYDNYVIVYRDINVS